MERLSGTIAEFHVAERIICDFRQTSPPLQQSIVEHTAPSAIMGVKKSTKKFNKNHLKETIDRRKEFAKIKQRHQVNDKRKQRNAVRREQEAEADAEAKDHSKEAEAQKKLAEMDMDEFFQGGFEIPESAAPKKSKKDVKPKTGKRKRTEEEIAEAGSDVEQDDEEASDSEVQSGSGSDDDDEDMKGTLDALAEKDPEFYKYLKENDAELLDFDDDLAAVDGLSEGDEDEEPSKKKKKTKGKAQEEEVEEEEIQQIGSDGSTEVTMAMIKKWKKSMEEEHSLRALRQVVLAFRAAAHVNEDDGKEYKYSISNPNVYHQVLVTALATVPKVLEHHLPVKESASGKIRLTTDNNKFRTLTPLLKSHTSSVHDLLISLSDDATLKVTLDSITTMLPYILQFRKFLKVIIKTIVGIWSDVSSSEATRIYAFLVIRRLMVIGDSGIREAVLKATYEGVVKGSKGTTVHTLAGVNLMKNSAAEIWGIDQNVGYTTGFTFIRQLAIHLRGSITNTSKESYKTIYNWQYMHSLDFWSRVLATHCESLTEAKAGKESALRPLIYPVVQITLGAMRLIPTAQYFPLRFQLMRSLLRISLATGTYIPLASALIEVLTSAEMKKPPKSSTLKPLDFATHIRAPKSYLRSRVYQDGVGEQAVELLSEFFILWTKNIAFPELSLPVTVALKRWLKEASNKTSGNKNAKVNSAVLLLVQKLEANGRWIEEKRVKVNFSPNDRAEVEAFLKDVEWEKTPLGAFVKGQRKIRAERAKLLEEGRKEEERRREKAKKGEDSDDEDDE